MELVFCNKCAYVHTRHTCFDAYFRCEKNKPEKKNQKGSLYKAPDFFDKYGDLSYNKDQNCKYYKYSFINAILNRIFTG